MEGEAVLRSTEPGAQVYSGRGTSLAEQPELPADKTLARCVREGFPLRGSGGDQKQPCPAVARVAMRSGARPISRTCKARDRRADRLSITRILH